MLRNILDTPIQELLNRIVANGDPKRAVQRRVDGAIYARSFSPRYRNLAIAFVAVVDGLAALGFAMII